MKRISKRAIALQEAHAKGYSADETGAVTSPAGKQLALHLTGDYLSFGVYVQDKGVTQVAVHRLVAYQKFGDAMFQPGVMVRHLNGNPRDNREGNIAIGSASDNRLDIDPESRSDSSRRRAKTMGTEALRESARKGKDTLGPKGRSEVARKGHVTRGKEGRTAAAKKSIATMGPAVRSAAMRKVNAPRRKLSPEQALSVVGKRSQGESTIAIARELGVTPSLIGQILRGQTYSDITGIKST